MRNSFSSPSHNEKEHFLVQLLSFPFGVSALNSTARAGSLVNWRSYSKTT